MRGLGVVSYLRAKRKAADHEEQDDGSPTIEQQQQRAGRSTGRKDQEDVLDDDCKSCNAAQRFNFRDKAEDRFGIRLGR